MRTFMHRTEGEPTNCHDCGEAPIMGCNYHDPDDKLHLVLCLDCASNMGATFVEPCNTCGTPVPEGEELGGDNEWLCPDCYRVLDEFGASAIQQAYEREREREWTTYSNRNLNLPNNDGEQS